VTKEYLKVKELVEGCIYGKAGRWYIYLGRDVDKKFCWLQLFDEKEVSSVNDINRYIVERGYMELVKTDSNRKIVKKPDSEYNRIDLAKLNVEAKLRIRVSCGLKIV